MTVNPVSKLDREPVPKIDLFANLEEGKSFTTLDLSQAYQQLPMDEDSRQSVVINPHKCLSRYTRLPWDFLCSSDFLKTNGNLLQGSSGVAYTWTISS